VRANLIFEAIKSKSFQKVKEVLQKENLDIQDSQGRTPLIYAITQHASIEVIDLLLEADADPGIEDKLGYSTLTKAIKYERSDVIERLLSRVELNHPSGIVCTPWFQARHSPALADLLLKTKGSIRLTLTPDESRILNEIKCDVKFDEVYDEYFNQNFECFRDYLLKRLTKLNTPELVHAFVMDFNWDDQLDEIEYLTETPYMQEITAIEIFLSIGGPELLSCESESNSDYGKRYTDLVHRILEKFPQIRECEALYL